MNILLEIWKDKLSDYVIMDYIAKIWVTGLLFMFVLGFVAIMYGIISGEADIQNATFGIFDTLGN
jgi:cbb3-type cytochrome oxidase subunit 3